MTTVNIMGLIIFWSSMSVIIEICISEDYFDDDFLNPWTFHEHTKMNWFGCWFFFILLSILSPLGFVLKLLFVIVVKIAEFLHFIFTVRRDD